MARAWTIPNGDDLSSQVCKALGINEDMTAEIIIRLRPGEPIYVYVTHLASTKILDIDWGQRLGQVKIIEADNEAP